MCSEYDRYGIRGWRWWWRSVTQAVRTSVIIIITIIIIMAVAAVVVMNNINVGARANYWKSPASLYVRNNGDVRGFFFGQTKRPTIIIVPTRRDAFCSIPPQSRCPSTATRPVTFKYRRPPTDRRVFIRRRENERNENFYVVEFRFFDGRLDVQKSIPRFPFYFDRSINYSQSRFDYNLSSDFIVV